MSGPSLHIGLPPRSLFKFPPDPFPPALPPPSDEATIRSPFPISAETYNAALDWKIPLAVASTYTFAVLVLNAYNRSRGNKPWAISQTRFFRAFVIVHNVFLAVFSGVTFVAMARATMHFWPGWNSDTGLVGAADALCKMHGPRGLADAATYDRTTNTWGILNQIYHLGVEGTPDSTDVGRLWNEGLAFWGWLFYLSKFYEIVDTLIIVAKGKRSATLQTYHHAGAMLCMWAGIRYMSPPIWMFVLLNSGIHTAMYTYFTLSTLGIRVPQSVKGTLTTLQIMQFVFGASYAAAHLFVSYTVPVSTPYEIKTLIEHVVSSASSVLADPTSAVSSLAAAATTAGSIPWLKKMALRAAGAEGLAENVHDERGKLITPHVQEVTERYHTETRYRDDYRTVHCIDTTGAAFAICLNLIYLAPLTGLFIRFFIRSYTRRTGSGARHPAHSKRRAASQSVQDAVKGVDREFNVMGKTVEDGVRQISGKPRDTAKALAENVKKEAEHFKEGEKHLEEAVKKEIQAVREGKLLESAKKQARRVSERVQSYERKFEGGANGSPSSRRASQSPEKSGRESPEKQQGSAAGNGSSEDRVQELKDKATEKAGDVKDEASQKTAQGKDQAGKTVSDLQKQAKSKSEEAGEKTEGAMQKTSQTLKQVTENAGKEAERMTERAKDVMGGASSESKRADDEVSGRAKGAKNKVKDEAEDMKDNVKQAANEKVGGNGSGVQPPGLKTEEEGYVEGEMDNSEILHRRNA
ncbi:hypothetical protein LTR66_010064 [Elasticomyces elasticus]|nr:hypothetical protein LTR66_010064 [Elasticomyces elasticus]